jgi:hypothetical protein
MRSGAYQHPALPYLMILHNDAHGQDCDCVERAVGLDSLQILLEIRGAGALDIEDHLLLRLLVTRRAVAVPGGER